MKRATLYCTITLLAAMCGLAGCAGSQTQESTGQFVDDSVLTTKVKTALIKDDKVDAVDIQVKTFKGDVQLSGFADSANEKVQAEDDAMRVEGVNEVKNDIRIKTAD
ncbi:MAG: BON domain-containing protein [Arenicellales bacterium]|jgi:osmotically-inducible protein OsmY